MSNTLPCSMFTLTNETINIWTHLIGFMYFSFTLLEDNAVVIPKAGGDYGDHFTFTIMGVCYLVSSHSAVTTSSIEETFVIRTPSCVPVQYSG